MGIIYTDGVMAINSSHVIIPCLYKASILTLTEEVMMSMLLCSIAISMIISLPLQNIKLNQKEVGQIINGLTIHTVSSLKVKLGSTLEKRLILRGVGMLMLNLTI